MDCNHFLRPLQSKKKQDPLKNKISVQNGDIVSLKLCKLINRSITLRLDSFDVQSYANISISRGFSFLQKKKITKKNGTTRWLFDIYVFSKLYPTVLYPSLFTLEIKEGISLKKSFNSFFFIIVLRHRTKGELLSSNGIPEEF